MNLTMKIMNDEGARKAYFGKLNELEAQRNSFISFTKNLQEQSKKQKKAEANKRSRGPVTVGGGTSKSDIKRLRRILTQKITEIAGESSDDKMKTLRISEIQGKIAALDRILSQIERNEMEERTKSLRERKKKPVESVHLTKENLTLKRNSAGSTVDVSLPPQGNIQVAQGAELIANFEAAIGAAAEVSGGGVDIQV